MNWLRDPLVLLALSVMVGWGVYEGSGAPDPLPEAAPADTFSAGRAERMLQAVYRDVGPHVSGSNANETVRDRIIGLLEEAGYRPEIQRRYHCNPMFAVCSPIENIIAVLAGRDPERRPMLVTAHYDSAWTSPGVADDGAGVAVVLEIARMARAAGDFDHDVIFLLSDAEEQGLVGAHAFAEHHPLFPEVRAVINLEARGVTGPSAMFETAPGNRGVIRLLSRELDRPVANSLTYEIYRRMPNDTDFSVYRDHPVVGVNFAFSEGVAAYHTEIDDLERLDRASLQHHGQNAWAMLRALDERTLDRMVAGEDAVYVDLFGRGLVHYPVSTAAGLALVVCVLVLIAIRRSFARQFSAQHILWTVAAILILAVGIPAAGWLLSWPLGRWPDHHALDHPWPWIGRAVLFFAAVWVLQRVVAWLSRRATTASVTMTCWSAFALCALVLATSLPAAAFVPLLPLLAFMIGLALDGFRWRRPPRLVFAGLFGLLAALYVGFYLSRMLETVTSLDQAALRIAPLVLPALAALPVLVWYVDRHAVGRRLASTALLLVLAGIAAQWLVPAWTPDRPRAMTVYHHQDAVTGAAWAVLESPAGPVDEDYAERFGFEPEETLGGRLAVPVESLDLPTVGVQLVSGESADSPGMRTVTLTVPANVRSLTIAPSGGARLEYARVDGQVAWDVDRPAHRPRRPRHLTLHQPPAGPVTIDLGWPGGAEAGESGPDGELVLEVRFDLPDGYLAPFREHWPEDAVAAFAGPRAVLVQRHPPGGAQPGAGSVRP